MDGTFTTISSGGKHVCGLRTDGSAVCEGSGEYGQDWPSEARSSDGELLVFEAISSGYEHTCAVLDGSTICYGIGEDEVWETIPREGETFASLSGGAHYTCGLRPDGLAFCWNNFYGEMESTEETLTAISSGWLQTCGLRTDGSAVCWRNFFREPTPSERAYFLWEVLNEYEITPPEGEKFTSISTGHVHTCGLRIDGVAVCWWHVDLERLLSDQPIYSQVFDYVGQAVPPEGEPFTAISSGALQTCALRSDGSVACWGSNERGQIAPPEGQFVAISSGYDFVCGLRTDDTIACWGSIDFG